MKRLSPASQRRFTEHRPHGRPMVLAEDHPAVVEGRSLFRRSAGDARRRDTVFVSGHNSRKIGKVCTKGAWAGMPIYTLTLEERKTCPRSCEQWRSCYGNKMQWPRRLQPGTDLERAIEVELADLQRRHPRGFIVRLHVLGDFYSVEYVKLWQRCLERFPALRVFGYTAHGDYRRYARPVQLSPAPPDTPEGLLVGARVAELSGRMWGRFAVRSSGGLLRGIPRTKVIRDESEAGDAIVCPAQTSKTECCATCALCWSTDRTIAFLEH